MGERERGVDGISEGVLGREGLRYYLARRQCAQPTTRHEPGDRDSTTKERETSNPKTFITRISHRLYTHPRTPPHHHALHPHTITPTTIPPLFPPWLRAPKPTHPITISPRLPPSPQTGEGQGRVGQGEAYLVTSTQRSPTSSCSKIGLLGAGPSFHSRRILTR